MNSSHSLRCEIERAARVALERLEKQAASGKWAAASLLVKAGAEVSSGSRPLPDLPDAAEPAEVRRAVYAMLREGKLTPTEAADIVRAFG